MSKCICACVHIETNYSPNLIPCQPATLPACRPASPPARQAQPSQHSHPAHQPQGGCFLQRGLNIWVGGCRRLQHDRVLCLFFAGWNIADSFVNCQKTFAIYVWLARSCPLFLPIGAFARALRCDLSAESLSACIWHLPAPCWTSEIALSTLLKCGSRMLWAIPELSRFAQDKPNRVMDAPKIFLRSPRAPRLQMLVEDLS